MVLALDSANGKRDEGKGNGSRNKERREEMNRPLELLRQLDEERATEAEYREVFRTLGYGKQPLKRGVLGTWRERLVRWAEREEAAAKFREQHRMKERLECQVS
jgi:hypothetical protein